MHKTCAISTIATAAWWVLIVQGSPLAAQSALPRSPTIPREVLFGPPEVSQVQISPDGLRITWLACESSTAAVLNVWTRRLDETSATQVTFQQKTSVRSYQWAWNNDQLLVESSSPDTGWDRLEVVNLTGGTITPLSSTQNAASRLLARSATIPDEILVETNRNSHSPPQVWRANLRTGACTLVVENVREFDGFLADHTLQVRVAWKLDDRGGKTAYLRDHDQENWFELVNWPPDAAAASRPLGFSTDGQRLYLLDSRNSDTAKLFEYISPGKTTGTYRPLIGDTHADVTRVQFDPIFARPQMVLVETDRPRWILLDESLRSTWLMVQGLTGGYAWITSRSRDDQRWIIAAESNHQATTWFLHDQVSSRSSLLMTSHKSFESLALARTESVAIPTRDGDNRFGYLTLPDLTKSSGPFPMVLVVHDAQVDRVHWGFHPTHQWLADQGYVALSVNYRGSPGLGKKFAYPDPGAGVIPMLDDLIDVVNWAVSSGLADTNRVAILGEGFGGYLAMMALVVAPDFYTAAVNLDGPCDIRSAIDPTPLLQGVDRITKPLLISQVIQNGNSVDPEFAAIINSLRSRSVPVELITNTDRLDEKIRLHNQMKVYEAVETFLAQYLSQPVKSLGSD